MLKKAAFLEVAATTPMILPSPKRFQAEAANQSRQQQQQHRKKMTYFSLVLIFIIRSRNGILAIVMPTYVVMFMAALMLKSECN